MASRLATRSVCLRYWIYVTLHGETRLMNFHQKGEKKSRSQSVKKKISRREFKFSCLVHSSLKSFHSWRVNWAAKAWNWLEWVISCCEITTQVPLKIFLVFLYLFLLWFSWSRCLFVRLCYRNVSWSACFRQPLKACFAVFLLTEILTDPFFFLFFLLWYCNKCHSRISLNIMQWCLFCKSCGLEAP